MVYVTGFGLDLTKATEVKELYSKIIILDFPPRSAQRPIVCQLVKKYDIMFNILKARISSKKEGHMVLELSCAGKAAFNKGVTYLKEQGIRVSTPEHKIFKNEERCTHCGACTAVCPTDALYIKRPEMEVIFDLTKCSLCERCLLTCPVRAMGLFSDDLKETA